MTGDHEAVLYALSAEPRSARAGDTIAVRFRTRNVGAEPSPAGTVAFALGEGLEPLDPLEVAVEPVAPGDDVVASTRARIAAPASSRTEIAIRAALHVPDAVMTTNACTIVVHGRPVLDGAAGGTYVEALGADARGEDRVRVRAVVVNEGDGPARGVRVIVPVPVGCRRDDGRDAEVLERDCVEVGESVEVSFDARIVAVVGEVCADDAEVRHGDGRCVTLPVRGGVVPEPVIGAPRVSVTASRRRADVAIAVRNDGWADARDVRVHVAVPAAWKWITDSFTVDGAGMAGRSSGAQALGRVERDGAARVLTVAVAPARTTVRLAFGAAHAPASGEGTIVVRTGEHIVHAGFMPQAVRDVRLTVADAACIASPGDVVRIAARAVNAGDIAERLSFAVSGLPFGQGVGCERTLPAGTGDDVVLEIEVPDDLPDDARFDAAIVARRDEAECARGAFTLHVRRRVRLELNEPIVRDGGRVRYRVRNTGSRPSRALTATFGETAVAVEAVAPHDSVMVEVDESLARLGGVLAIDDRPVLALPSPCGGASAAVRAEFLVPEETIEGAPIHVALIVDVIDAVDILVVTAPAPPGTAFVPGTANLDDRVLLDGVTRDATASAGGSPFDGCGVVLRGVPASRRLTFAWALRASAARPAEPLAVVASVVADDDVHELRSSEIAVRAREHFAARPLDVPYHVQSCGTAPARSVHAAQQDASAVPSTRDGAVVERPDRPVERGDDRSADVPDAAPGTAEQRLRLTDDRIEDLTDAVARTSEQRPRLTMRLDDERLGEIARLFADTRAGGLVGHLFLLRFFFPDAYDARDGALDAALGALRSAMRDVYDRLFVKLRIPGFDVSTDDLEDTESRSAAIALFDGLRLHRRGLEDTVPVLAEAPYGSPAMLRALVGLLPERCDGDDSAVCAALARYAALLDDALARYEGLPLEVFDDALAHRADIALDRARAELIGALRSRLPAVAAAC